MNFTMEIKREIMANGFPNRKSINAFLSAFILSSGYFISDGQTGFRIVTETELTAEYFINLMESNYNLLLSIQTVETEHLRGRDRFIFETKGEKTLSVLKELSLLDENGFPNDLSFLYDLSEDEKIAFIKGIFIGSGSCTIPSIGKKTGYHLEFVFSDEAYSDLFYDLLLEVDIVAKKIVRKSSSVVYVQSRETLSDFLNLISTMRCLEKLNAIVEEREQNNQGTRVNNCFVSNVDRTAAISAEQCRLISALIEAGKLEGQTELRDAANMRLAFPMDNYQQLADKLGITKSSLSRRLKRLMDLGKRLTEEKL